MVPALHQHLPETVASFLGSLFFFLLPGTLLEGDARSGHTRQRATWAWHGPGAEHHLPIFLCCVVNANRRGRERKKRDQTINAISVGRSVGQRATVYFLRLAPILSNARPIISLRNSAPLALSECLVVGFGIASGVTFSLLVIFFFLFFFFFQYL